jgi:glycosyltransferase involved in cell wall biosynthesis
MDKSEIKILHIITELPVGGAQDNTLLTVKGLKDKGYQVDMAAAPGGAWEDLAQQYSDKLYHIQGFSANNISLFNNIKAIIEVYKVLKENSYHIIHTHSSTAGVCARIAAKLAGVPLVIHTVHGFPFHDFMSSFKKNFLIYLEKFSAMLSDYMITVSKLNLEEIVQRNIAPRHKLVNIYSGIDIEKFKVDRPASEIRAELEIPEGYNVVGLVARLSKQKAPGYFVEAAKQILQEKEDVIFLIVGDGPLRAELETQIGDEDRIRMLGARENVPEILSILDVFALSSIYEGLGRAMTEAMIAGKPVVAPSVNGIPEVVKDKETGFLTPTKAPEILAEKILILLNNPDLRKTMGENARKTVIPAFSHLYMIDQIEALYIKLLDEKLNIKVKTQQTETIAV